HSLHTGHEQHELIRPLPRAPVPVVHVEPPATTEIYTLSLHDALPIWRRSCWRATPSCWPRDCRRIRPTCRASASSAASAATRRRSEEHTSELQSRGHLVCRLLLEKKKKHDDGALGAPAVASAAHLGLA